MLQFQALFLLVASYAQTPPVADFTGTPTSGNLPLNVAFSDASFGTVSSWSWDFGDGGSATSPNPSHVYTTAGTYTVSLSVTGPDGSDSETKVDYIVVTDPPPTAQFFGSPILGQAPLEVSFTSLSSGNITSYSWAFGDGDTSTATNPIHLYFAPGFYTVNLMVTGPGGSDTETKVNYITANDEPPVADFSATPSTGYGPLLVAFTDQSSGGAATTWSWTFGDSGTSTLQNPTHVYAEHGSYTVSLTVTGSGGTDTVSRTGFIVVKQEKFRRVKPRPNIALIILDDVGVERIGAYQEAPPGITAPCTPNLDSLAASGLLFRHAWANPICSPTRAQIMTGRHGFRTGVGDLVDYTGTKSGLSPTHELCLPRLMTLYDSSAVGKWHLANPTTNGLQHAIDCGFRSFAGSMYNLSVPAIACGSGCTPPDCSLQGPLGYYNWVKTSDPLSTGILEQSCTTTYATTDSADEAIARAQVMHEPWFLQVGFNAVHTPLDMPPAALCPPFGSCPFQFCQMGSSDPAELTSALTEALDTEIGRMVAALRLIDPNVMIFVVGDNGTVNIAAQGPTGECFDPDRVKGTLFEGGIRVPLIVAGPSVVPGECSALVGAVDLFATFADLALVPQGAEDSVSLLPYLRGNMQPRRSTMYAEIFTPNFVSPDKPSTPPFTPTQHARAIRNERYKLIRYTTQSGYEDELFFDLELDPCETTDLCPGTAPCDAGALTPSQASNLQALRNELAEMGVL